MKIDLLRFAGNFSLFEAALTAVGRQDVFAAINTPDELTQARRPILAIPAGGPWNFYAGSFSDSVPPEQDAFLMIEKALAALPSNARFELCIDFAGEGLSFYGAEHDVMAQRFAAWNLDPERTFVLTSRIDAAAAYEAWCAETGRQPILKPIYTVAQLFYVAGAYRALINEQYLTRLIGQRSPQFARPRPKKFLCLNYSPREARWATVLHLMSEGLLDQGLVSFYGRSVDNGPVDSSPSLDFVEQQLKALSIPSGHFALIPELDRLSPLVLDNPEASRSEKAYGAALQDFYADTYFSIVTESDFIAQAGSRFTEKVLKPMINLHPFVLIGTQGVLAELRRLGFRTFSPYINESYDSIEDHGERLRAALAVATSLIRMPADALRDLYNELWPILTHNMLHLIGGASALVDQDPGFLAIAREDPAS